MTKRAVTYNDFGIRTLRGVYWLTSILVVLMINVIIIQAVQTGQHHVWTATKLAWVLAIFLNTVRILNRLKRLEATRQESDDDMKLMFHLASMFPIIGYLPFVFCFR